jgi:hypothetical protein
MRRDAGALPAWPVSYPTRDEAITAALDKMEAGDILWVHQDSCAMKLDEDCDCAVSLVPFPVVVQ